MRYSYTNVSTFAQCPYRWKLQYKDRLKTIPDTAPDNALWLGLGLHKGVEEWSVPVGIKNLTNTYIGACSVQGRKIYGVKVSNDKAVIVKRTEVAKS